MGIQDVKEIIKSCRFCFMCRHACPTFLATKLDSHTPRGYALLLSQIDEGYRDWTPETVDRFYQCSQCGLCREDCEYHWPEDDLVRHAREEIVESGRAPERVEQIAAAVKQTGTPYREQAAAWNPPSETAEKTNAEILYFAGCSTRQHHPEIMTALSQILQTVGADWTMLPEEGCCGTPLFELGYTQAAHETARALAEKIAAVRPKILLTGCPHCFRAFKEFYPQWGIDGLSEIEIVHTSQYLSTLLADGTLALERRSADARFCYHDPCQLGRKMGEYETPRTLIEAATGQAALELFHAREHAECCGAGAVMFLTDPAIAQKVARKRLERVSETAAGGIITACQNCKTSFCRAQAQAAESMPVLDITELIASRLRP